jgi:hypothetical protein
MDVDRNREAVVVRTVPEPAPALRKSIDTSSKKAVRSA